MTIHIKNLEIYAIIGILDAERVSKQKIIVDMKILYDYNKNNFINYADISNLVEKIIIKSKFLLIEDALLIIQKEIIHLYPKMEELEIEIKKPDIIPNCIVSISKKWIF